MTRQLDYLACLAGICGAVYLAVAVTGWLDRRARRNAARRQP